MNQENLRRLSQRHERWATFLLDDASQTLMYCDGRIIAITEKLVTPVGKNASEPFISSVVHGTRQLWPKVETGANLVSLSKASIFGSFGAYWRLFLHPSGEEIGIDERFVRCFSEDSEWRGQKRDSYVSVYEDGTMVGVVMPLEIWYSKYPEVPYLADDVLYHVCGS